MLSIFFMLCPDKVSGVKMDLHVLSTPTEYLFGETHKKNLMKWLNRLIHFEPPVSDLDFGKLKVDFEKWYFELGGETFELLYDDSYLLTPSEAAKILGVSNVTLHNKFIKQGLEVAATTSHKKIPKHAIALLQDPVYAIRIQMVAQKKHLPYQTAHERLLEINSEITELQLKYGTESWKEAFSNFNGDEMDDPTDYYLWKDLDEEKQEILKLRGGKN